ncbi:hypothetical protein J4231_00730 [Candidatus Woesearchaeota archaeon]|nr:hypothetical protein [Candidatus Woesearchaeota archaeon]
MMQPTYSDYCKAELAMDYNALEPNPLQKTSFAKKGHGSGIDVCLQDLVSKENPRFSSHICIYLRGYRSDISPYLNGLLSIRSTELETVPLDRLKAIVDKSFRENGLFEEPCIESVSNINLSSLGVYAIRTRTGAKQQRRYLEIHLTLNQQASTMISQSQKASCHGQTS